VLFDLVYAAALLGVFSLLVDRIGIRSVVYAYVAAHVSHAVLHYGLARRTIGFRLGRDNRLLLGASGALLLGLAVFQPHDIRGVALGGAAILAWALVVVRRSEWVSAWGMASRFATRFKPAP
jgi:hypothetical protein